VSRFKTPNSISAEALPQILLRKLTTLPEASYSSAGFNGPYF